MPPPFYYISCVFILHDMLFAFLAGPLCMSYVLLVPPLRLLVLHFGELDKFSLNARQHLPSPFSVLFIFFCVVLVIYNLVYICFPPSSFFLFCSPFGSIHLRRRRVGCRAGSRASGPFGPTADGYTANMAAVERIIFNERGPTNSQ